MGEYEDDEDGPLQPGDHCDDCGEVVASDGACWCGTDEDADR